MALDDVTPVVLAGGQGTRLGGVNKALLDVGGRRVIERVLDALLPLAPPDTAAVVVANDDALARVPRVRIVRDVEPRAGALVGLYSGLRAVATPLAVAVACDMPFLCTTLFRHLVSLAEGYDAVVPLLDEPEPLHAVYRTTCLPAVEAAVASGRKRVISFFDAVRVRYVAEDELRRFDPELRSFSNINTPDDLERARAIASAS
jgi:molybdopterin-guanine dinucleotide biosynthesis protein A